MVFAVYFIIDKTKNKKQAEKRFYPTSFLHETEPRKRFFLYGSNELARPRQKADVEKLKTDNFQLFFE